MYTNVVYFNHSKGKAAKNNADKAKTLVCGAFTGAVMVLGLKFGNTIGSDRAAKGKDYERVQLFAKRFKEELGSDTIICRELLGLSGPSDPDPAKRTKEYYQKRPCPETVAIASGLLGEFME